MIVQRKKAKTHKHIQKRRYHPSPSRGPKRDWGALLRKTLFTLLVFLYFSVGVYVFLFWSESRIQEVVVTGTNRIAQDEVTAFVQERIGGEWIVPYSTKRQYVLVSANRIEQQIRAQFGIAKTVRVQKKFPNRIVVDIVEWDHVYLWCENEDSSCFVLGEDGLLGARVLEQSHTATQNPVTRIIDGSPRAAVQGDDIAMVTPAMLTEYVAAFADLDITIDNQKIFVENRVSKQITFKTISGWDIIISTRHSVVDTMVTMRSIWTQDVITQDDRERLSSVDLRVLRKAFFRVRPLHNDAPTQKDVQNDGNAKADSKELLEVLDFEATAP